MRLTELPRGQDFRWVSTPFIAPSSNAHRDPTNTQPASAKSAPQNPNTPCKRPRAPDSNDSDSDKPDESPIKRRARSSSSSSSSSDESNPSPPRPAQRPRVYIEKHPLHDARPSGNAEGTRYYIGKNPINYKRPPENGSTPYPRKRKVRVPCLSSRTSAELGRPQRSRKSSFPTTNLTRILMFRVEPNKERKVSHPKTGYLLPPG